MSYLIIVHQMMNKHGIPLEDTPYVMAMIAVTATDNKHDPALIATNLITAPRMVVESMKTLIRIVKEQTTKMEADPAFMDKLNRRAAEFLA